MRQSVGEESILATKDMISSDVQGTFHIKTTQLDIRVNFDRENGCFDVEKKSGQCLKF